MVSIKELLRRGINPRGKRPIGARDFAEVKAGLGRVGDIYKRMATEPITVGGKKLVMGYGPAIGPASPVGAFKSFTQGISTFAKRAVSSPFAGMTGRQALGAALAGAAGTTGAVVGTRALFAAASGDPFSLPTARTLALTAIGGAITPLPLKIIGVLGGFARRGEKRAVEAVTDIIHGPTGALPNPFTPTAPITFNFPDEVGGSFAPPSISGSVSGGAGFPSGIGFGSGPSFDPALLALLLGGGIAGGYLLGKRKRRKKRKKYKHGKRKR